MHRENKAEITDLIIKTTKIFNLYLIVDDLRSAQVLSLGVSQNNMQK